MDGDVYNVTVDKRLHPPSTYPAAGYEPAKRRELHRPSTIDDVADFVVDYIISDVSRMRRSLLWIAQCISIEPGDDREEMDGHC